MNKVELRKKFSQILEKIPVTEKKERSLKGLEKLKNFIKEASLIGSFSSIKEEPDLSYLNKELASSERLALPRVTGENIIFYKVKNLDSNLILSKWNILEPNPNLCQKVEKKDLSLLLVPGLVFDELRYRVGYGKGFYDRYLFLNPKIKSCGIAFSEQQLEKGDKIPIESYDMPLDSIFLF